MSALAERLRTFHVERRVSRVFTFAGQLFGHIRQARLVRLADGIRLDAERKLRAKEIAAIRAKQAERAHIAHLALHATLLTTTATTARSPNKSWN